MLKRTVCSPGPLTLALITDLRKWDLHRISYTYSTPAAIRRGAKPSSPGPPAPGSGLRGRLPQGWSPSCCTAVGSRAATNDIRQHNYFSPASPPQGSQLTADLIKLAGVGRLKWNISAEKKKKARLRLIQQLSPHIVKGELHYNWQLIQYTSHNILSPRLYDKSGEQDANEHLGR